MHVINSHFIIVLTWTKLSCLKIGNVYLVDAGTHRIRKITVLTGIITTIAGTGTGSFTGDNGAATSATFNEPRDVLVDSSGILSLSRY